MVNNSNHLARCHSQLSHHFGYVGDLGTQKLSGVFDLGIIAEISMVTPLRYRLIKDLLQLLDSHLIG